MKKLLVIVLAFSLLAYTQKKEPKAISLTYIGYHRNLSLNDLVLLQFEIENNSNDTVYLSVKNINLKIFKNAHRITEENAPTYLPFIKPIKVKKEFRCEEKDLYEKKIKALKQNYAMKLYIKNFDKQKQYERYKNTILENIVEDCIILKPNETIDYETNFYSKKFDKTCKVTAEYSLSKSFTSFIDDNGKKVDIYY